MGHVAYLTIPMGKKQAKQPKKRQLSALEIVDKRGGPNMANWHKAVKMFKTYRALDKNCNKCSGYIADGLALAAVYECGIIEGKRQERARRKRKAS